MSFEKAFALTIGIEGGFTADPKDRGNWTSGTIGQGTLKGTKYGISAMIYPTLDIANITLQDAKAIYKRDYWDKAALDTFPAIIADDLFDFGVNAGFKTAFKCLQRAVGVKDDGIVGPATMAAINVARNSGAEDFVLYTKFCAERIKYYTSLSTFSVYGRGWMNRVATCMIANAKEA
ncbi:putative glycosyl hydrolase [Dickeya phage Amaethon]|nr:putative glycosyl hydrolase [Dickeya phage Amaethon]